MINNGPSDILAWGNNHFISGLSQFVLIKIYLVQLEQNYMSQNQSIIAHGLIVCFQDSALKKHWTLAINLLLSYFIQSQDFYLQPRMWEMSVFLIPPHAR